jgi:hypothetical protein
MVYVQRRLESALELLLGVVLGDRGTPKLPSHEQKDDDTEISDPAEEGREAPPTHESPTFLRWAFFSGRAALPSLCVKGPGRHQGVPADHGTDSLCRKGVRLPATRLDRTHWRYGVILLYVPPYGLPAPGSQISRQHDVSDCLFF